MKWWIASTVLFCAMWLYTMVLLDKAKNRIPAETAPYAVKRIRGERPLPFPDIEIDNAMTPLEKQ